MRSVRRSGTDIELRLRRALWRQGVRYRVNRRIAGTRPDLTIGPAMIAVFVDGCFWHGCPRHWKLPWTNPDFWQRRVDRNAARDRADDGKLREADWRVLRFWACELKPDISEAVAIIRAEMNRTPAAERSNGGQPARKRLHRPEAESVRG